MESPRTVEILEALRWLSLTPGEQRKTPPPELTPLSEAETGAVRKALEAAEMGLDVASILTMEASAEERLQTPEDRKRGKLRRPLPHVLEILKRNALALFSFRVRMAFLQWLSRCPERDARKALRLLRGPNVDPEREALAGHLFDRIAGFIEVGMTKGAAVRAVAEGKPAPVPKWLREDHAAMVRERDEKTGEMGPWRSLRDVDPFAPPATSPDLFPASAPLSIGRVLSLLRSAERAIGVPPRRAPHKRPGRNKRETPGNPVYSGPKTAQEAGLSTLPSRRSTGAEGKRNDELPNDNRSRRPAQGAATNAQGLETQRKGAAILEAVRKPRAVRGRGAVAVSRGSDVRSHGRGDDSARKRPGRVKEPP